MVWEENMKEYAARAMFAFNFRTIVSSSSAESSDPGPECVQSPSVSPSSPRQHSFFPVLSLLTSLLLRTRAFPHDSHEPAPHHGRLHDPQHQARHSRLIGNTVG
jgi:hypothetical protein